MKITDVNVYQLGEHDSPGSATWASNSILLKLTTSDGTVGFGEAVPTLRVQPVIQALREVERVYKGKDPLDVEKNMHEWHKHDFYMPMSFESTTAASAFDIACWDIIGKHFGASIHDLVGGTFRSRVRLYLNGWYNDCVTPAQFGEAAKKSVAKGYTALKFDPFGDSYDYVERPDLNLARSRVKAVQDVTEGKIDLLIEHHGRFNPTSAIMAAKMLEEFSPLFAEEPIHPDNIDGLKKYRAATSLRVALGERLLTKEQVVHVLSSNLADFLQIDLTNIGGITQARKVSAIAESYGVEMAFHNAFGPVQNAATIQLDASIPNFLIQESFYDCFPEWKRQLVNNEPKIENGYSTIPKEPGIGLKINEKILDRYKVEGQEYFNPAEPVWVVKNTWKNPKER